MSIIKVPYHKQVRDFNVPEGDVVEVIKPAYDKYGDSQSLSEAEIINQALDHPIGKPKLGELVDASSKVALLVDDNTRPTPTSRILPAVLRSLKKAGVKDENITIIFARGTHRELSVEEEKTLLGKEIWDNYRVIQHESRRESDLVQLPDSNKKANKWAYKADLRLMIGFIKSHDIAGYSGGSKSILPGVADYDTILNNHSYDKLSDPNCGIGILDGNPCREEMDKMARALEPNFIINVVLNREDLVVQAAAGDVIAAHREGVRLYNEIAMVKVNEQADMVMACCPYPTDSNLYQSLYGGAVTFKVASPIVKKDGVIILVSHCPEGIGDESFTELIMEHKQPDKLLKTLAREDFSELGQWAAQLWADLLNYAHVILVSEGGIPDSYFEQTPMKRATSLDQAWQMGKEILDRESVKGYILPRAPLTLPLVAGE